jgi:hypothetical protein
LSPSITITWAALSERSAAIFGKQIASARRCKSNVQMLAVQQLLSTLAQNPAHFAPDAADGFEG